MRGPNGFGKKHKDFQYLYFYDINRKIKVELLHYHSNDKRGYGSFDYFYNEIMINRGIGFQIPLRKE